MSCTAERQGLKLPPCGVQGLAYVEFEDEAQASHAVMKMDGTVVQEHTLTVAISNPPRRNMAERPDSARVLGSMMPRQLYGA